MKTTMLVDYEEIERYQYRIEELRKQTDQLNKHIQNLEKEIKFLKDNGDEILVIIKTEGRPDYHEYKTSEKCIITDMIVENNKVRDKNDSLTNQNYILEQNLNKSNEENNNLKSNIESLNERIKMLENRKLWNRIINKI